MQPHDTPRLCECGCGQAVNQSERPSRQRRFISGHNIKPIYATIEDRFWASCIKHGPNECWEWQGNKERKGYGLMNFRHKDYLAHRISYSIHYGPIPDGMLVCHRCDNPPCTNPDHLFLGTPADNSADMAKKNRHSRTKTRTKVTETEVIAIRKLYADGVSQYKLAPMFGLTRSGIAGIVRRTTWSDIP